MLTDINRKIKIAQVITRLDWGGSPDIVRIICQYLNSEVYDVRLIIGATRYPGAKTKEFLEKFKTKSVIISQLKREINPLNDLLALFRLYFLFRREKFDIVHTHTAKAGALGRMAAYLARQPIIVHTPHGHNFYGYFGKGLSKAIVLIERFLANFTDKIIALTELEKNDFIRFKIAPEHKLSVIYQGLELDRSMRLDEDKIKVKNTLNIESNDFVVGMIGRLEPIKGPGYFVEAAKYVAQRFLETKFIIVGEGSLRRVLEKKIEEYGLRNRFTLLGWREDIGAVLSILDILVLPSLNEAVGMVLIEAQAQGIPIVATQVGGIPEIVRNNQTGILVPAGDSKELAKAISYLLADVQKRLQMSEAAKEWVRGRFEAKTMVEKISELYKELIDEKNISSS
jgi:glycosyltransferase involved in cell wall biosynthesis